MGYNFVIPREDAYHVKFHGHFPWPCEAHPNRTIELFRDDVLTKSKDGTYTKQTGICCVGIILVDAEVEHFPEDCNMRLL